MVVTGDTKKKSRTLILAGILTALAVAVPLSLYGQGRLSDKSPLEERLERCAIGSILIESLRTPAGYQCFSDLVLEMADSGRMVEFQTMLIKKTAEDQRLYYPCHDALHAIGAVYYEKNRDLNKVILETPIDACGYAFVHGNIDAFGKSDPTEEQMYQASVACQSMNKLGEASRVEGLCYHGLGHAAWLARARTYATKEEGAAAPFEYDVLKRALELCEATVVSAKASCGDGLLMDAYVPVNGIARGIKNGQKELPGICEKYWNTSDELLGGCYSGAVYIVNHDISEVFADISKREEFRDVLTPADEELIWTIFEKTINMCDNIKGAITMTHNEPLTPRDQCYSALEREVLTVIYTNEKLVDKICSRLYRFEDWCRQEVAPLR